MSSGVGLTQRKGKGGAGAQAEEPAAAAAAAAAAPAPAVDDEANKGKPFALPPVAASAAASSEWIERYEVFVPWLILAVATFSRYYRLDKPTGVVFGSFLALLCAAARCVASGPRHARIPDSRRRHVGSGGPRVTCAGAATPAPL